MENFAFEEGNASFSMQPTNGLALVVTGKIVAQQRNNEFQQKSALEKGAFQK